VLCTNYAIYCIKTDKLTCRNAGILTAIKPTMHFKHKQTMNVKYKLDQKCTSICKNVFYVVHVCVFFWFCVE